MKTHQAILSLILTGTLLLPFATLTAKSVEIAWENPDSYRNVTHTYMGSDRERDSILRELKAAFEQKALTRIPENSTLEISFTQVELAGQFEPWRGHRYHDIRVVRDIYPARLHFTWRLLDEDSGEIRSGEERLTSMGVTQRVPTTLDRDSYPYVKEIYNRWVERTFR